MWQWIKARVYAFVFRALDGAGYTIVDTGTLNEAFDAHRELSRYVAVSGSLTECWQRRPNAIDRLNAYARDALSALATAEHIARPGTVLRHLNERR